MDKWKAPLYGVDAGIYAQGLADSNGKPGEALRRRLVPDLQWIAATNAAHGTNADSPTKMLLLHLRKILKIGIMSIHPKLSERCGGICELCSTGEATIEFTVSPRPADKSENQVAICSECAAAMNEQDKGHHWRCLEGSIWNAEPAVQALSYRILQQYKAEDWAAAVIESVEPDEAVQQWALSAFEVAEVHRDAFGNELQNGDTVVLTQGLNVKGTSFTAAKGTIVKRIRLVPDNTEQIEGKINEQTIVILTRYVKKG